jgi:chemotaxis methyl-accepting protein methylase
MFSVIDRDRVRDYVLELAASEVASLERDELLRALQYTIQGLLRETEEVQELADKVEPQLHELTTIWES